MQEQMRRVIGERLRQARIAAELTQQDVATDFMRTRQSVSSWEAGRTLPNVLELRDLAILYGVTTDLLLIGVDDSGEEAVQLLDTLRSKCAPRLAPSAH
jgi:transcriptional regulator with XRE-family HTH domain